MKKLIILPAAAKALRKHKADADRIVSRLREYASDPASQANNIKAMIGSPERRLRIGNYRAIFVETDTEIIVNRIGPRGSVYR